jgi:hypothetical protein
LGNLLTVAEVARPFWATFFQREETCNNSDNNGFGYTLGDFLKNASGHPAAAQQ